MSKKGKTITIAPAGVLEPGYRSTRAVELRRTGRSYDEIAEELKLSSAWDAAQLVSIGYAQTISETGDQMRSASEDRILDVIRKANDDLARTASMPMRIQLYKAILSADAQLSKLYGLALPEGLPDAPLEGGA